MDFFSLVFAEINHAGEDVNLPHDYMIHTDVSPDTAGGRKTGLDQANTPSAKMWSLSLPGYDDRIKGTVL